MDRYWPRYDFDAGATERDEQQQADRDKSLVDERKSLYCYHCLRLICFTSEATRVSGRYEHVFTNPAGQVYHIACYANAPGCSAIGAPTFEYTWFAAYRWQIAVCIECRAHLGWIFTGADTFFGLICNRLVAASTR